MRTGSWVRRAWTAGKHIKLYMVSPNAPDGKMLHSIRPGILRQEISTMTSAAYAVAMRMRLTLSSR